MADKSRRKSSILKPPKQVQRAPLQDVNTLNTRPEADDDLTANTITQTTSLRRRVSFAGHNTVKEFYSGAESVSVWHAPSYQEPLTVSSDSSGVPADQSSRTSNALADGIASQERMCPTDDPYEEVVNSLFGGSDVHRRPQPKRTARFSFGELDSPDQKETSVKTLQQTTFQLNEQQVHLNDESCFDHTLEDDVFTDSHIAHSTAYHFPSGNNLEDARNDNSPKHALIVDEKSSNLSDMEETRPIPGLILEEGMANSRQVSNSEHLTETLNAIFQGNIQQLSTVNIDTNCGNMPSTDPQVTDVRNLDESGMELTQALTNNINEMIFFGSVPVRSPVNKLFQPSEMTQYGSVDMEMTCVSAKTLVSGPTEKFKTASPRENVSKVVPITDQTNNVRFVQPLIATEAEKTQVFDHPPDMEMTCVHADIVVGGLIEDGKTASSRENVSKVVSNTDQTNNVRFVQPNIATEAEKTQVFDHPPDMEMTCVHADIVVGGLIEDGKTASSRENVSKVVSNTDQTNNVRFVQPNIAMEAEKTQVFDHPPDMEMTCVHADIVVGGLMEDGKTASAIENVSKVVPNFDQTNNMSYVQPPSSAIETEKTKVLGHLSEMRMCAAAVPIEECKSVEDCKSTTPREKAIRGVSDIDLSSDGMVIKDLHSKVEPEQIQSLSQNVCFTEDNHGVSFIQEIQLSNQIKNKVTGQTQCSVEKINELTAVTFGEKLNETHYQLETSTKTIMNKSSASPPLQVDVRSEAKGLNSSLKESSKIGNTKRGLLMDTTNCNPHITSSDPDEEPSPAKRFCEEVVIPPSRSQSPFGDLFPALSPAQEKQRSQIKVQAGRSFQEGKITDCQPWSANNIQHVSEPLKDKMLLNQTTVYEQDSTPTPVPQSNGVPQIDSHINTTQGQNVTSCLPMPAIDVAVHLHEKLIDEHIPVKLPAEGNSLVSPHKSLKEAEHKNKTSEPKSLVPFVKASKLSPSRSPTPQEEVSQNCCNSQQSDPFETRSRVLHSPLKPDVNTQVPSAENRGNHLAENSEDKQVDLDICDAQELPSLLHEMKLQSLHNTANHSKLHQKNSLKCSGSAVLSSSEDRVTDMSVMQAEQPLNAPPTTESQIMHPLVKANIASSLQDQVHHPTLASPAVRNDEERIISRFPACEPNEIVNVLEESLQIDDVPSVADGSLEQDSGSELVHQAVLDVSRKVEAMLEDPHSSWNESGGKSAPDMKEKSVECIDEGNNKLLFPEKKTDTGLIENKRLSHRGNVIETSTECHQGGLMNRSSKEQSIIPSKLQSVQEILMAEKKRLPHCEWEATQISGMLWSFKFILSKLELQIHIGSPCSPYNHVPASNGKLIWVVDDSTKPILWLGMEILKRKLSTKSWSGKLQLSTNLLQLLSDLSDEVALMKHFMVELIKAQKRNSLEVTREWMCYDAMSTIPFIWFRVKINLISWENILPSDVTVENIAGNTRESVIQNLVTGVEKDVFFLENYIRDINDYIETLGAFHTINRN